MVEETLKRYAEIVDPWLNGDPCEGCTKCDRLCLKLKERIESVLAEKDKEIERLREALKRIEQYDPLNPNWQAQIARAALKGDE